MNNLNCLIKTYKGRKTVIFSSLNRLIISKLILFTIYLT